MEIHYFKAKKLKINFCLKYNDILKRKSIFFYLALISQKIPKKEGKLNISSPNAKKYLISTLLLFHIVINKW